MIRKFATTLIISFLIIFLSYGQETYFDQCVAEKGEKGTQGRQEDQWSKKLIKKEYSVKDYTRYSGTINISNEDTIKYDDEVLIVSNTCKFLKLIFQKGIIYPALLTGELTAHKGLITNNELDSLRQQSRSDSLQITDFEEIKFIKKSSKTKIFRFWLYSKDAINPTVCFVALANYSATRKTDITTFINGSRLTFFARGWIVI